jgi:sugar lactone lactonase YvrE
VTALAVTPDGALYAGTSPEGKVYRVTPDGRAEVYFDPADKYIWSLALMRDGALAVATGDTGRLYRVRAAGAKPETSLLADINETHVISLSVDAQGNLLAGTDPSGLVLRVSPEGKVFALFDSPLREVHALVTAPDGSTYALAVSDAASGPRPAAPANPQAQSQTVSGQSGSVSVTITSGDIIDATQGAQTQGQSAQMRSRNDLQSARSAVFRIRADGGSDVLWSSNNVTAFSIAASPKGGVLVGTSDKGRIYSVTDDGRDTLLVQSSEDQISNFVARGPLLYAASSNQGKLFRFGDGPAAEGTYESPVRDARFVASWGRIRWRGQGQVELQTRTGNTERPDMTWSEWSAPYRDPEGAPVSSPRARFIQWRAVLRAPSGVVVQGNAGARIEDVSLAYLPRNVAPEVLSVQTLPVGVALLPAMQVQADPNLEASGLDPALFGVAVQVPPRRAYQRGAVSLQWQAEDRNGDQLEYSVYYRAVGEDVFRLLKSNLRENFYAADGAALGNGRYVFRIVVSDAPSNAIGQALTGERLSEPVDVDNTPPSVRAEGMARAGADGRVRAAFVVEDLGGMVKRADVSIDGDEWRAVFPDDGIADSPRETYTLDLPVAGAGEHTISLRAFDAGGNVSSARIVVRR